jgi:hypothetical protein
VEIENQAKWTEDKLGVGCCWRLMNTEKSTTGLVVWRCRNCAQKTRGPYKKQLVPKTRLAASRWRNLKTNQAVRSQRGARRLRKVKRSGPNAGMSRFRDAIIKPSGLKIELEISRDNDSVVESIGLKTVVFVARK